MQPSQAYLMMWRVQKCWNRPNTEICCFHTVPKHRLWRWIIVVGRKMDPWGTDVLMECGNDDWSESTTLLDLPWREFWSQTHSLGTTAIVPHLVKCTLCVQCNNIHFSTIIKGAVARLGQNCEKVGCAVVWFESELFIGDKVMVKEILL